MEGPAVGWRTGCLRDHLSRTHRRDFLVNLIYALVVCEGGCELGMQRTRSGASLSPHLSSSQGATGFAALSSSEVPHTFSHFLRRLAPRSPKWQVCRGRDFSSRRFCRTRLHTACHGWHRGPGRDRARWRPLQGGRVGSAAGGSGLSRKAQVLDACRLPGTRCLGAPPPTRRRPPPPPAAVPQVVFMHGGEPQVVQGLRSADEASLVRGVLTSE